MILVINDETVNDRSLFLVLRREALRLLIAESHGMN